MKYEGQIVEVVQETPRVFLVRIEFPGVKDFRFRPGQWVGVLNKDFLESGTKRPLRRAFSIASLPGNDVLELCIAKGVGLSKFLIESRPGTEVRIDGPYGMFGIKPGAQELMFIAAGTGIAPFRPMIDQALKDNIKTTLIYCARSTDEQIYRKEFESLPINTIVSYTRQQPPGWTGETTHIPKFLHKYFRPADVYICGPPAMVEATQKKLLELGQPKDKIHVEKW